MTHLTPNLIGIVVPKDANDFIKSKFDSNGNYILEDSLARFKQKVGFDFKILGTSTENINGYLKSKGITLKENEKLLIIEKL